MRHEHAGGAPAPTAARPLTQHLRTWFLVDSFLVLVAGIQLFVLTGQTERFFAWTIADPLTAAFLGASYWASLPLVYLASRQADWAHARIAVFGVLVFTTLTLVATLLHLDRFHLGSPDPVAAFAAWMWMVVYLLVPPTLVILTALQLRVPGGDPARRAPLPRWVQLLLGVQALVLLVLGALLFVAPLAPLWPWTLTPLTGRAVASWLVGIGIIAAHAAWENDLERLRGMLAGYTLLACLQLLALVRYPGGVDWARPHATLYLVFLASVLAAGAFGMLAGRRSHVRQYQS